MESHGILTGHKCTNPVLEPSVIPATKQNNTDKKLDFSTGRVSVQCDKSENKKL